MNQIPFSKADFQHIVFCFRLVFLCYFLVLSPLIACIWPLFISASGGYISHIGSCLLAAEMMASSQVEFAAGPAPFGHVHARHSARCFENNVNNPHLDYTDLWVHQPHWEPPTTPRESNGTGPIANIACENEDCKGKKMKTEEPVSGRQKDSWARAREIFGRQADDTQSESAAHSSGGGVSSLVRKWGGFKAMAKLPTSKSDSDNNATTAATNNNNSAVIPDNHAPSEEESFGDWEPDRMAVSGPPSIRSNSLRGSDATEKDRLRVSDIIKKLTEEQRVDRTDQSAALVAESSVPRVRTSFDHTEQRGFSSPVVNSPRIRGRQAFHDLLMQMERERHKELEGLMGRGTVSKFSHRGRIQALLRFKFLNRGVETKEARHSNGAASSNQPPKLSHFATVHGRERVRPSIPVPSKSSRKESKDDTPATEKVKENRHPEEEAAQPTSCPVQNLDRVQDAEGSGPSKEQDVQSKSQKSENINHEVIPLSTFIWQQTNHKNSNFVEFEERAKSLNKVDSEPATRTESMDSNAIDMHAKDEDANHIGIKCRITGSSDLSQCDGVEEASCDRELAQTCPYWVSDVCHGGDEDWEELNSDDQQEVEGNNTDWIYEVSRPRSDWEDLRQARYQEMLDPFRENEEIRSLLGRKSVSSFLTSDLRNQIDRVMLSRCQGQHIPISNQTQDAEESVHEEEARVEQVVAVEEENREDDKQDNDMENYGDYYDEYEEAESSVGQQYNECDDYITSASPTPSWPQNQGHEATYSVASPSPQRSLGSNFYSQDGRQSSCVPPMEMELIYDLRRHMEQLQLEMSELRRTIKSCVNMQSKLQRSMKREVSSEGNPSDEKKAAGMCRICCKLQVDSLLYRCGHMCTCFKCAQELQWSSGKCPICRAPIMDVVQAYYSS